MLHAFATNMGTVQNMDSPVGGPLEHAMPPLQVGPERVGDEVGVLGAEQVQPLKVGEQGCGAHVLGELGHEDLEDLLVDGGHHVGVVFWSCGGRGGINNG